MMAPGTPPDETERLEALRALDILDTQAEERFDRLTRLAQQVCEAPIALVSLVDGSRQWFKSRQGLAASETPREVSFCGHAIHGSELFLVPDATADQRFADNPLVTGPPQVRAYAGAPLQLTGGQRIGTLCVIDRTARTFTPAQLEALRDLADLVVDELEAVNAVNAMRSLRDHEARLRAVLETVIDGIITIDARGTVHSFNPAAERIFGYSAREVIGKNVNVLMPDPDSTAHDSYLRNYLRTSEAKVIGIGREVHGLRRDGSVFPMDLSVGEMLVDGERFFTGIVRDITDRKKMQQMKAEFVSTVSHELRTPLTSIRGALGLVLGKASDGLSAKARTLLEAANRNSERLTLLINDILDIERLEAGRMAFDFGPRNLVTLVEQAIAANDAYARGHSVGLHLASTPGEEALVWADDHRIGQVLANLLSNAAKFSEAGADVVVSVTRRGKGFRVSVVDQGRGIPEAFRPRLFERFSQADSSDTREKGGTGLGLHISKLIVDRHGGTIDYVSEEGVGTEFFFDLPRYEELVETTVDDVRPRLLICEDDPDTATILGELLDAQGLASDRAGTAAAARSLLEKRSYRAVLLDLALPDGDGLSVIRELRADDSTFDLPVIVVSGRAEEGRVTWTGDPLSVVDWLDKPIDTERLSRALDLALRGDARPKVLHVEDDPDLVETIRVLLDEDIDSVHASSLAEARRRLAEQDFDVVLLDLTLPDGSGLDLLSDIGGDAQVLFFSGHELDETIARLAAASLTKSKASDSELLATIRRLTFRKQKGD